MLSGALAVELPSPTHEAFISEVVSPDSGLLMYPDLGMLPRGAQVRALVPSTVIVVEASKWRALLASDHVAARLSAEVACRRVSELQQRVSSLGHPSSRRRVLHALSYLDRHLGESCALGGGRVLRVVQADVAAIASVTRQTANRILRGLQADGLIRIERAMICGIDSPGLATLVQGGALRNAFEPCGTCQLARPSAILSCRPEGRRRVRRVVQPN